MDTLDFKRTRRMIFGRALLVPFVTVSPLYRMKPGVGTVKRSPATSIFVPKQSPGAFARKKDPVHAARWNEARLREQQDIA
jgi:hypothetical protein